MIVGRRIPFGSRVRKSSTKKVDFFEIASIAKIDDAIIAMSATDLDAARNLATCRLTLFRRAGPVTKARTKAKTVNVTKNSKAQICGIAPTPVRVFTLVLSPFFSYI